MCSRIFLTSLVVFLAFLAISNGKFLNFRYLTMLTCLHLSFLLKKTTFHFCLTGMSLRSLGVEQHCRCIQTESRPIGRHIGKVELIPPNSHCEETEIM